MHKGKEKMHDRTGIADLKPARPQNEFRRVVADDDDDDDDTSQFPPKQHNQEICKLGNKEKAKRGGGNNVIHGSTAQRELGKEAAKRLQCSSECREKVGRRQLQCSSSSSSSATIAKRVCEENKSAREKTQQREREGEREQTTETLFPRVVEKDQNLDTHAKPTTTRLSLYFHLQIQIRHVEKITCSPAILANRTPRSK